MALNRALAAALLLFSAACSNVFHDVPQPVPGETAESSTPEAESNVDRLSVIYTSPYSGESGVEINSSLLFCLNRSCDPISLTADLVEVRDEDGTVIPVTVEEADSLSYIIKPSSGEGFLPDTVYTVSISADIRDSGGIKLGSDYRWSFTTGREADLVPPAVLSGIPGIVESVSLETAQLVLVFSEPVDPSSIENSGLSITRADGVSCPFEYSYNAAGGILVIRPDPQLLVRNTHYNFSFSGISDLSGNVMISEYSQRFSLGAAVYEAAAPDTAGRGFFSRPDEGEDAAGAVLRTDYGDPLSSLASLSRGGPMDSVFDGNTSGPLQEGRYIRFLINGSNVLSGEADRSMVPVMMDLALTPGRPGPGSFYVDPDRGEYLLPGPVFWSRMEDSASLLAPESGGRPGGIIHSSADLAESFEPGKFGNALFLSGVPGMGDSGLGGGYFIMPFASEIPRPCGGGAVSFWFEAMPASGGETVYVSLLTESGNGAISISSPIEGYLVVETGEEGSLSENTLNIGGGWVHVYVVWDEASTTVYVNGDEIRSLEGPFCADLSRLYFSADIVHINPFQENGERSFVAVDNLKIWDSQVSPGPDWEYSAGAGLETGLHPVYGAGNGYSPVEVRAVFYSD